MDRAMRQNRAHRSDRRHPASRQAGFTLIELLIAMAVMAEVMAVAYILFDVNTRIGRTQVQVADMQQNHRIAQHDLVRIVRMAGRGGLPQNLAVLIDNNVPANTDVVSDSGSPSIVEDTDVLRVRGVFTAPIYQVLALPGAGSLVLKKSGNTVTGGTIQISETTALGTPQPLDALKSIGNRPEALLLVSAIDDTIFATVEVSSVTINGNVASVDFKVGNTNRYRTIAPFPLALTSVSFAAVLEEYKYYVREDFAVSGDPTSEPAPKLSRARVYPGSDDVWDGAIANASVDIADNILDLQVALGFDVNNNDSIDENDDDSIDEWRYNHKSDNKNDVAWQGVPPGALRHFYTRLTTLARTDRPDQRYRDDPIQAIEDHDYSEPTVPADATQMFDRQFRRRQVQTIVDMRNLG